MKKIAKAIGPIPIVHGPHSEKLGWRVRFKVPHLPFYIDSEMIFTTKEQADEFFRKWKARTIAVEW